MPLSYAPVANVITGRRTGSQPAGQTDSFGIPKMFADTTLAFKPAPWEMGVSPNWDSSSMIDQWDEGTGTGFTGSGINTIWDRDTGTSNIRQNVFSEGSSWSSLLSNLSRDFLASRLDPDGIARGGYMARPSDWRDLEITCAMFLHPEGGADNCGWYARGGRHSNDNPCEGFKYDIEYFYSADSSNPQGEVNKETAHNGCCGQNSKTGGAGPDITDFNDVGETVGQWCFWKEISRTMPQGWNGAPAFYPSPFASVPLFPVDMEFWIIKRGLTDHTVLPPVSLAQPGQWTRLFRIEDDLDPVWGNNGGCGGPDGAIGSWGGPVVTLRIDLNGNQGYGHITMGYTSVREIDPAVQVNTL